MTCIDIKKCGNCIHYEVCSPYVSPNESFPEADGGCKCFKPAESLTEVVRCKDCFFWQKGGHDYLTDQTWGECHQALGHSGRYAETEADDFCSYGERK